MSNGTIKKIAGPLVIAKGMRDANMFDVVRVSDVSVHPGDGDDGGHQALTAALKLGGHFRG